MTDDKKENKEMFKRDFVPDRHARDPNKKKDTKKREVPWYHKEHTPGEPY